MDELTAVQEEVTKEEVLNEEQEELQPKEEVKNPAQTPITITDFIPNNTVKEGTVFTETTPNLPQVATFSKVSFESFLKVFKPIYVSTVTDKDGQPSGYKEEEMMESAKLIYDNIILPTRSNKLSSTYNFYMPFGQIELAPGSSVVIPTGVKVDIKDGWSLDIYPEKLLAYRYGVIVDNIVDIYDKAHYNNPIDEGQIVIKISNTGRDGYTAVINYGNTIAIGKFSMFGITTTDEEDIRKMEEYQHELEHQRMHEQGLDHTHEENA